MKAHCNPLIKTRGKIPWPFQQMLMVKNCPWKVHHCPHKTFSTSKQLARQVPNIPYKERFKIWLYNHLEVKNSGL